MGNKLSNHQQCHLFIVHKMITTEPYYHYMIFGVTYEEIVTTFMKHGIVVFKYCPGILQNDHYVAFKTTLQKKKQFNSLDPKNWIQTNNTFEWYQAHGHTYNDVVIGHMEYDTKKCILS